jgi:hypothetical protein
MGVRNTDKIFILYIILIFIRTSILSLKLYAHSTADIYYIVFYCSIIGM